MDMPKMWKGKRTYFNSIKVRLERTSDSIPARLSKFQFHKGTIRTNTDNASECCKIISIP